MARSHSCSSIKLRALRKKASALDFSSSASSADNPHIVRPRACKKATDSPSLIDASWCVCLFTFIFCMVLMVGDGA